MSQTESVGMVEPKNVNARASTAHECQLTVLTESAPFIQQGNVIGPVLGHLFGTPGARHDLLSVPSLKHLLKDKDAVEMLCRDVMTAVEFHNAEKLLVASATIEPRRVIQRLRENRQIRDHVRIKGFTVQRPARYEEQKTLVVACMSWRLHGPGGFGPLFARAFGASRYGLVATPGAAMELAADTVRSRTFGDQLELLAAKGLERVVLVSHTDCSKYGGNAAFADRAAQLRRLRTDLEEAALRLRTRFPKLKTATGIAHVENGVLTAIEPCASDAS